MYILKNAWTNIKRNLGRNILIGIIILVITASSCIALAINTSGNKLIDSYINKNQLEVSFNLDMKNFRQDKNNDSNTTVDKLTIDDVKKYSDSDYVSSYYYTLETSLSSDEIEPIDMNEVFDKPEGDTNANKPADKPEGMDEGRGGQNQGDFKITAYSDVSYIDAFVSGTSKITDGNMITNEDKENNIVISEDLADENDLKVGDTVKLYSPSDSNQTYEFNIIGIFETESDSSDDNFMNIAALNSQNQIYITETAMNTILENTDNANSLNAKFYLKDSNDLDKFEKEVREKGLSDYYNVSDNTDQITATLKPIQNISNFSLTFLIIILIVGAIILAVINMLNIRDRKYEIGVLRAIGMSKSKLITQLILELFIIAVISFIIGTGIGYGLSQPVTNKMLENEISSYQEEQTKTENNFGGKGFNKPNLGMLASTNYVDNLDVSLNAITILELFGVSILLVIISGSVSALFVTKYEPNKILQNRN